MENQITFEYEIFPNCTVVALNAQLSDFQAQPIQRDGKEYVYFKERTIKDCRNIDGCIYLHKGHVSDSVMCDLIEKFNKLKKESKNWKERDNLTLSETKIIL